MSLTTAGGASQQAFSNTSNVVDQLGMAIVSGDYAERTMIPLDPDLEEMFGVSRTVIREAKKTLVGKGLLQSKAKVGTRVRPSSDWSMFDPDVLRWHVSLRNAGPFLDELFAIRMVFEPAAAASMAERAEAREIDILSRQCKILQNASDRLSYAVASSDFHKTILHFSGNRFLSSLGEMVQTAFFSVVSRDLAENDGKWLMLDRSKAGQDYAHVVDAIAARDAKRAEKTMAIAVQETKKLHM
ncbi:FadR/GntR family transcriptional regulator [Cohaesibacter celericrescens]|uniref:FadR/GntR family transcriptional regulator n=1 Tax=Cohaesibacter celericrescens TaxID=2067669 RepID=UPI00356789F7